MAFAEVTYANLLKQAQEDVWRLIDESATIQTYTKTILSNFPASCLTKNTGFPFIVVPIPSISEEQITMGQKRIYLIFNIEIWFKKLDSLVLVDALRTLLSSNDGTFSGPYNLNQFLSSGGVTAIDLPDGSQVNQYILSVEYEWIGDPS